MKSNQLIRNKIAINHIKYPEIAERLGLSLDTFHNIFRHELSPDQQRIIHKIIKEILKEREQSKIKERNTLNV